MAKQLMIYERAVPVSSERHRDWAVQTGSSFGFAREVNSVPLLAAEFTAAATDCTVVFAGDEQTVFPSVILGMRSNRNDHVDANGKWTAGYIPAFLRRYPFVFARSSDGRTFTLCIDEEFEGFNKEGRGERLFDSEGNRTQYLKTMLDFTREYQSLFERTQLFCRRLKEHDLLQQAQANFNLPDGERTQLGGFYTIDRNKLKALAPEVLAEMAKTDELELCYVHLQSLNNLTPMARRVAAAAPKANGSGAAVPSSETEDASA